MTYERVGKAAGAALGFIGGNVPGAIAGYGIGGMLGRKRDRRGRQGKPAGKKRKGAGSRRRIAAGRKRAAATARRRFRKTVKKIVKQTVGCDSDEGIYSRVYSADTRIYIPDGNLDVCLFGGLRNGDVIAPYTAYALSFTPHSVNKCYDAVSVLYNAKARSINHASSGNFAATGFKFELLYASYETEFVNNTQTTLEVELHEFTNKSNSNTALQDNIDSAIDMHKWPAGGTLTWTQFNAQRPNHYKTEIGFPLSRLTSLSKKYSHKLVKYAVMPPGAKMVYKSTRKMECIDMTKYFIDGTTNVASYCKGDKQLMLRLKPKLHVGYTGNGETSIAAQGYSSSAFENAGYGLIMKSTEYYKVLQPGETDDGNTGDRLAHFIDVPVATSARVINYTPNNYTEVNSPWV